MAQFLRSFQVSDGVIGAERSPETLEDLYVTPQELLALYGCQVSTEDVRAAQATINAHCNRTSLWPCEYEATLAMPADRQETRLPITPVIQLTDLAGRYGAGRRDRLYWSGYQSGLAAYQALAGGRPQWTPLDVSMAEITPETGILFVSTSWWFMPYQALRAKWVAGYIDIPDRVKLCVFELINTFHTKGVSDRISRTVGRVASRYASHSFITPFAEQLLSPFVVQARM